MQQKITGPKSVTTWDQAMSGKDPFTGNWVYQPEKSKSSGPKLERWVQWIEATSEHVRAREEVVVSAAQKANVSIEANFDGGDYPVTGSSFCDAIAYTRLGPLKITGIGKKNGNMTLRETIEVAPDREVLTLTFMILSGGQEMMNGVAVFAKQPR